MNVHTVTAGIDIGTTVITPRAHETACGRGTRLAQREEDGQCNLV